MKNNHLLFIYLLLLLFGAGCKKDFLDRQLDTNYTEDQVFGSYGTMRDFGLGIYAYLPNGFAHFSGAMLSSATDESVHSGSNNDIERFNNGSWSPYSNPDDQWSNLYTGIRKANLFLEKSQDYKDIIYRDTVTVEGKQSYKINSDDMKWLRAEARFLRAYFYFELAKRYGGVPVIDHTLSIKDTKLSRNTFDETISFISSEVDTVKDLLRGSWSGFQDDKYIGRATKGAALALKSRVLLYAASSLHNPNNDLEKWKVAAQAANDIMTLNSYSLSTNYGSLSHSLQNPEFILARQYGADNSFERTTYPVGFDGAVGGTNPSENLVDAYETVNGKTINEDNTYDPQNPYLNRDPRLTMTIIVNNSIYKGRNIETFKGGMDGFGKPRATRTGYYLKKYADENLDLLLNKTSSHAWILFRYGEILLNYAEAMNEAYGPDIVTTGFTINARQALNMIRKRQGVNMPDVIAGTRYEFRQKVRNERRIELAFEEHRFWDVRRWKISPDELSKPILGVSINKKPDGTFAYTYSNQPVENRIFQTKMYLYPIPKIEINKTEVSLVQNIGW